MDAHVFAYAFFGNFCQAAIDRNLTKKMGGTPGVIRSLELDLVPPDRVSMQGNEGVAPQIGRQKWALQAADTADANTSVNT